jgi:hypothetical protein
VIKGRVASPGLVQRVTGGGHGAWLPLVLTAIVVGVAAFAALLAPGALRGPAVVVTAALVVVLAYVVWPKPAMLVFALVVLFYHTLGRWLTPDLRHLDEIVVPAMFAVAIVRTRPWQRGLIEPRREGTLLVMFGFGVVSSVVNGVPFAVWSLGFLLVAKVFAFLYVVVWHDFEPRDIRQLYPLVLAVGVVVLALVPIEAIDPEWFRQVLNLSVISTPREGLPSVKSVFYHPVLFAWFSAFVGLYLAAGYVVLRRWWLALGAALFGVATILAGRRRAISSVAVALVGGIVAHFARVRSWRATARAWWPAAVAALVLALAFLPSLIGLADLTLTPGASDADVRGELYTTSVLIARDSFPFGVGFGRYGSGVSRAPYSPVYAQYGLDRIDGLSPAHSSFVSDTFWPRVLGETGALGLIALVLFTLILTRQVWRAAQLLTSDRLTQAFVLGTWMVFVQALVETLASSLFDSPPRIYLLFGAVGVTLSLARNHAAREERENPSGVASMPSLSAAK